MIDLPILLAEATSAPTGSVLTIGFVLAIIGVAVVASLIVSLMNYYFGDPNALVRSSQIKNCGLGFLAAAVSGVLFILAADGHVPKLSPFLFILFMFGAGIIGLFSGCLWYQLLVSKGGRMDGFAESDFSEPERPRRRWET